ncbi:hypothetical protein SAMN02910400_01098 [Lachnospiraceae bacterium C10]|nr:hypothetical protein SAMN02910400_01098 [Lachnospiraceae bacterium C10]
MALERTGDEFYAKKMFHLGLVHDIGYQFTDNSKEHAHVGGEFLREEGYEYWKEVYDHGNPDLPKRPSDEWFILNMADMQTDGIVPIKGFIARKPLYLKGLRAFLYFSDTKMMTSPRRVAGCKMSNFISVIFVFDTYFAKEE